MRVAVVLLVLLACLSWSADAGNDGSENGAADGQRAGLACSLDVCQLLLRGEAALKEKLEEIRSEFNLITSGLREQLELLKQENKDQSKELEDLRSRVKLAEQKQGEQQLQIEDLKKPTSGQTNVVFSASLRSFGTVGPYKDETTLKYANVFTNVGNGFDSSTGIFTVPVSGVYLFMFYDHALVGRDTYLALTRNGQRIVTAGHQSSKFEKSHGGANAVTLQLDKGDTMCIRLWAGHWVFDDDKNYTTFTGILLFTV